MHIHNISPTKANIIITVSLTRCPGRTLHNFFQWSWPQISRKCICDSRLLHRWLLECLVVLYIAINKKQETRNKCIIFPLEMCSNLSVISSTLKLVCKCHLPLWPLPPPLPLLPTGGRAKEQIRLNCFHSHCRVVQRKGWHFRPPPLLTPSYLKIGSLFSANLNSRKNLLLERVFKISENRLR